MPRWAFPTDSVRVRSKIGLPIKRDRLLAGRHVESAPDAEQEASMGWSSSPSDEG